MRIRFACCMATFLFVLVLWGFFSLSVSAEIPHRVFSVHRPASQRTVSDTFKEIWKIIAREHLYTKHHGSKAQVACLQKMLIGGLSYCLNDPHSRYITQAEIAARKITYNTANRMGVGLELISVLGQTVVSGVIADSPADRSGLFQKDDIIVEINGKDVRRQPINVIVKKIHGLAGTPITIRVDREGKWRESVTLLRELVTIHSVIIQDLDDDITYIRIRNFDPSAAGDLFEEIANRVTKVFEGGYFVVYPEAKKFVLDVRKNHGGFLKSAVDISTFFARNPRHVILTAKSRHATKALRIGDFKIEGVPLGIFTRLQIVILVDDQTASAAEIVAEFIHQATGAPRVGTQTYGKGTLQRDFSLKGGDALHLTIAEYFVGNAKTKIDKKGITPEYEVENPAFISESRQYLQNRIDPDNDLQLKKAIELLRGMQPKE